MHILNRKNKEAARFDSLFALIGSGILVRQVLQFADYSVTGSSP
jgi:hypothetical protein